MFFCLAHIVWIHRDPMQSLIAAFHYHLVRQHHKDVMGGIINGNARQDYCGILHLHGTGHISVHAGMPFDKRSFTRFHAGHNLRCTGHMYVPSDHAGHQNRMVVNDCVVTDSDGPGHKSGSPNDHRVGNDSLMVYQTSFAGDGVIEDPAGALLTQVFLTLNISAQITGAHTGTKFRQRPNPVKPRVSGMGDLADLILLVQRASSFLRCLVLVSLSLWASVPAV